MQLVTEFLLKGKDLWKRLRLTEGTTLSKGDLHLLRSSYSPSMPKRCIYSNKRKEESDRLKV
jgi:hypothetical protein